MRMMETGRNCFGMKEESPLSSLRCWLAVVPSHLFSFPGHLWPNCIDDKNTANVFIVYRVTQSYLAHTDVRPPYSVAGSRQVYKSITDPLASTGRFTKPTKDPISWSHFSVELGID